MKIFPYIRNTRIFLLVLLLGYSEVKASSNETSYLEVLNVKSGEVLKLFKKNLKGYAAYIDPTKHKGVSGFINGIKNAISGGPSFSPQGDLEELAVLYEALNYADIAALDYLKRNCRIGGLFEPSNDPNLCGTYLSILVKSMESRISSLTSEYIFSDGILWTPYKWPEHAFEIYKHLDLYGSMNGSSYSAEKLLIKNKKDKEEGNIVDITMDPPKTSPLPDLWGLRVSVHTEQNTDHHGSDGNKHLDKSSSNVSDSHVNERISNTNDNNPITKDMNPNGSITNPTINNMNASNHNMSHMNPNMSNMNPNTNITNPNTNINNPNMNQTGNTNPNMSNMNPNMSNMNPNMSNMNPNMSNMNPNMSNMNPNSFNPNQQMYNNPNYNMNQMHPDPKYNPNQQNYNNTNPSNQQIINSINSPDSPTNYNMSHNTGFVPNMKNDGSFNSYNPSGNSFNPNGGYHPYNMELGPNRTNMNVPCNPGNMNNTMMNYSPPNVNIGNQQPSIDMNMISNPNNINMGHGTMMPNNYNNVPNACPDSNPSNGSMTHLITQNNPTIRDNLNTLMPSKQQQQFVPIILIPTSTLPCENSSITKTTHNQGLLAKDFKLARPASTVMDSKVEESKDLNEGDMNQNKEALTTNEKVPLLTSLQSKLSNLFK